MINLKSVLKDLYSVRPVYAEQAIEALSGIQFDDLEDEFQDILKDSYKLSKSVDNLKKIFSSVKIKALVGIKPPKPSYVDRVRRRVEDDIRRTIEKGISDIDRLKPKLSKSDLAKLTKQYPVVKEYEDIRKRSLNLLYSIQNYAESFRKYAPDYFAEEGKPKFGKIDYMVNKLVDEIEKKRDEVWSIIKKISDKKVPNFVGKFSSKIVDYIKKNVNPKQSGFGITVENSVAKISENIARFVSYIKITGIVDRKGRPVKELYIAVYTDVDYSSFSVPVNYVSVDYYFVMPKDLSGTKCNLVSDALRKVYRDTSAIDLFRRYDVNIDKSKLGVFKKFVTVDGNTLIFRFNPSDPRHRKFFDDRGLLSAKTQADIIIAVQKALNIGEEVEVVNEEGMIERTKVGSGGKLTTPRHYRNDAGIEVFEITVIPV